MSGKHLCQSRLSAAYISSNRYMHIILFYFIFVYSFYFPQGYPSSAFLLTSSGLHRPSSVLHPDLLRSSFVLPSSFIRLFHILHPALFQPSFIFLRPSSGLPSHFPLFSPLSFQLASPRLFQCSPSPSFSLLSPRHSSSRPRHSRLDRESLAIRSQSSLSS